MDQKLLGNITGIATSIPELLTTTFSASIGFIESSLFNIVSSNVINLVQYLFSIYLNKNQKHLNNKAIKIDLLLVIITIFIPFCLILFNAEMNSAIVIIFLVLLVLFYYINNNVHKLFLKQEDKEIIKGEEIKEEKEYRFKKNDKKTLIKYIIYLIVVISILYLVGEFLSSTLKILGNIFGLSEIMLGILLGIVTSIPELITFIEAQRKNKENKNNEEMNKIGVIEATNNLLTSNVLNLFFIQSVAIVIFLIFGK